MPLSCELGSRNSLARRESRGRGSSGLAQVPRNIHSSGRQSSKKLGAHALEDARDFICCQKSSGARESKFCLRAKGHGVISRHVKTRPVDHLQVQNFRLGGEE